MTPEDITPLNPQETMLSLRREIAALDIKMAEQRAIIAEASACIAKFDVEKTRAIAKFDVARDEAMTAAQA